MGGGVGTAPAEAAENSAENWDCASMIYFSNVLSINKYFSSKEIFQSKGKRTHQSIEYCDLLRSN